MDKFCCLLCTIHDTILICKIIVLFNKNKNKILMLLSFHWTPNKMLIEYEYTISI